MKIDIFPHIFPRKFYERMQEVPAGLYMQKRTRGIPVLVDLELRLRIMDRYEYTDPAVGLLDLMPIAPRPVFAAA